MGNQAPHAQYHDADPKYWDEVQIDRQKIIKNSNYPASSYAILSYKRPKFLPQVQDTFKNKLGGIPAFGNQPTFELLKNEGIYYTGKWQLGKQNGEGIIISTKGFCYKGTFKNGTLTGNGTYIYPDGSFYNGNLIDGVFEGLGTFWYKKNSLTYEGAWKAGKPEGKGKQTFPSIGVYQGDFKNGFKHGKGVMKWNDGRQYVGDFSQGYMHGLGRLRKKEGMYQGQFDHNNKVNGIMKTQYGTYNGPYVQGQMSGKGTFTWKNGNFYDGNFLYNKLHGNGTITLKSGNQYKGQWENGINVKIL